MRLDLGMRANVVIDHRVAAVGEGKSFDEHFASLKRYAL